MDQDKEGSRLRDRTETQNDVQKNSEKGSSEVFTKVNGFHDLEATNQAARFVCKAKDAHLVPI